MINVMVSGAGGDAGIGVITSLRASGLPIKIFSSCIKPHSAGLWLADKGLLVWPVVEDRFLSGLIKTIKNEKIDFYIPTVDSEILPMTAWKTRISTETGCEVLVGNSFGVEIANDKLRTQQFLVANGLASLKTWLTSSDSLVSEAKHCLPIVLKPRFGAGSRDQKIVRKIDDQSVLVKNDFTVAQEYLEDETSEFTAGVFVEEGSKTQVVGFWRSLRSGSTVLAQSMEEDSAPLSFSRELGELLGFGYWNVQGRMRDGVVYSFDVNPRFSGSIGIVSQFFNAPAAWVAKAAGLDFDSRTSLGSENVYTRYLTHLAIPKKKIGNLNAAL